MSETALRMCERLERLGFENLKVSLKAFDVRTTVEANLHFARRSPLPLHIGVTEAGPVLAGTVRSAAALGILLHQGVGDTLRVSLSASPEIEVRVGVHLLRSLGLRRGPVVVSCPTCGRTRAPVQKVAARIERLLERLGKDLVVAVMGCEVNGPGEARQADIGVAFGPKGTGLLFERGTIVESAPADRLERLLEQRLTAGDRDGGK
ncbi:MAG: hypothetical protein D6806_17185 [Deltaproteobacteria bacterium]|nr:MAG: hypothetical protein D6806_17185 [Deltaproteobacteria bacterium]